MIHGLTYTLRLLEPVLANSLAGDANSAQSLPFIPGGLIRGALIGAYLRQRGKDSGDAANTDFRRLFLSGQTRYLHAYPLRNDKRGAPVPAAWKKFKHEGGTAGNALNLAVGDSDAENLKGMNFTYWWKPDVTVGVAKVSHQVSIHTQRDAIFGRAREGQGAVFRYEALPSGMLLQGVILAESQTSIEDLKSLFPEKDGVFGELEIWLGKGRTGGYGRVRIEDVQDLRAEWREGWQWEPRPVYDEEEEESLEPPPPTSVSTFILTFLSAGLVRNQSGQFTLDPLPALCARLGVNVRSPERVFRGIEIVGGFNRTWGLPLPQVGAIQAGSVYVIEADSPISMEALQRLEEKGIGERRAEGFGRVRVDVFQPLELEWAEVVLDGDMSDAASGVEEWPESAIQMADLILRRLLRQELDEDLLKAVQEYSASTENEKEPKSTEAKDKRRPKIPNNQLSRWRTLIRSVLGSGTPNEKLQKMTSFYAKEQERHSYGWRAMERARIGTDTGLGPHRTRLTEWIFSVLTDAESPWKYLRGTGIIPSHALGDAVQFQADEELRIEYKLRLIDGVLTAIAKRQADGGPHG